MIRNNKKNNWNVDTYQQKTHRVARAKLRRTNYVLNTLNGLYLAV